MLQPLHTRRLTASAVMLLGALDIGYFCQQWWQQSTLMTRRMRLTDVIFFTGPPLSLDYLGRVFGIYLFLLFGITALVFGVLLARGVHWAPRAISLLALAGSLTLFVTAASDFQMQVTLAQLFPNYHPERFCSITSLIVSALLLLAGALVRRHSWPEEHRAA